MKIAFSIVLLFQLSASVGLAQGAISVASNTNGLVVYNAQYAFPNTHLFVLYGDGYFGMQQQPQHRFAPNSKGYDTEAYFARGYHPNLPTKRVVNTGPVTSGSTFVNPPVQMNGEIDVLTSWAMASTYETFLILAFRNTQHTEPINGCVELLLDSNQLSLRNNGIREYNNWVNNQNITNGVYGAYNQKIKWDFNNLTYQETRFVYIPVTTISRVNQYVNVKAGYTFDCDQQIREENTSEARILVRTFPHDPNFKTVDASCLAKDTAEQKLVYTIGFFNNGQNFVQNVTVLDDLSPLLDPNTVALVNYEYLPNFQVNGNQLQFEWQGINLPGTNQLFPKTYSYEDASTFVSFSICTNPNLETLDCIENQATILFDILPTYDTGIAIVCTDEYCDPVRLCTDPISLREVQDDPNPTAPLFQVHPNPFDDRIHLKWNQQTDGMCQVSLLDFSGKKIRQLYEGSIEYLPKNFDLSMVSNGIYLLSISTENEIRTQKIIKQ